MNFKSQPSHGLGSLRPEHVGEDGPLFDHQAHTGGHGGGVSIFMKFLPLGFFAAVVPAMADIDSGGGSTAVRSMINHASIGSP